MTTNPTLITIPAPNSAKKQHLFLSRKSVAVFTPRIGTRSFNVTIYRHNGRIRIHSEQLRWTRDGYPAFFTDGTY